MERSRYQTIDDGMGRARADVGHKFVRPRFVDMYQRAATDIGRELPFVQRSVSGQLERTTRCGIVCLPRRHGPDEGEIALAVVDADVAVIQQEAPDGRNVPPFRTIRRFPVRAAVCFADHIHSRMFDLHQGQNEMSAEKRQ